VDLHHKICFFLIKSILFYVLLDTIKKFMCVKRIFSMKLEPQLQAGRLTVKILDHITGVREVNEIKQVIDSYSNIQNVELNIVDAFVMPSALIGYLVKLNGKDQKTIYITANKDLKKLLVDLNLDKVFILG